jgi:hypothetical protein
MPEQMDMRLNQRAGVKADISYWPFTSTPASNCNATVLNCSEFGLCFKASRPLTPGQCIYIRTTQIGEKSVDLRCASLAQVRWCDQNPDPLKVEYLVGASYL